VSAQGSNQTIKHPALYSLLKTWRNATADELDLPVYMILPTKTMIDLVTLLPQTQKALLTIKGFGKKKTEKHGPEILDIVKNYCTKNNIEGTAIAIDEPAVALKLPKPDTKFISFELYIKGKPISEIAAERGISVSTIENHLAHYIGTGELEITRLVDDEKIRRISEYFMQSRSTKLGPAKAALGEAVSWGELRYVLQYLKLSGKNNFED
jgi:hypothetical protein